MNKPLRIVRGIVDHDAFEWNQRTPNEYGIVLSNLAIAEASLVKAGKDSAMPHFLAIVKELERIYGFTFEQDV